jgi:hypothetical protein
MANFHVWSYPGLGSWLLGFAWLLAPVAVFLERRTAAPGGKRESDAA